MRTLLAFALLSLAPLAACGGLDPSAPEAAAASDAAEEGKADALSSTSTYYTVRPIYCFPSCGTRYRVARVNMATTRCQDGTYAASCTVSQLDFRPLQLSAAEQSEFSAALLSGHGLVRGNVAPLVVAGSGNVGTLVVSEAWRARTNDAPTGGFYRVSGQAGALHIATLNQTYGGVMTWIGYGSLATEAQATVNKGGTILAAGQTKAPGVYPTSLTLSQYYWRVLPSPNPATECEQDSDCTATRFGSPIPDAAACYCPTCPTAIVNAGYAQANQAEWNAYCAATMHCPYVACAPAPRVFCTPLGQCVNAAS